MISKLTAIIMTIVSLVSSLSGIIPTKQVVYNDVSYGTHERNVMDICFPADAKKNVGAIVYIHGGSWIAGDKQSFNARMQMSSKKIGCISAAINYRYISDSVHCVDLLQDIDKALDKIKSMAETRGLNCDKVMLVGVSAGAHLAMLYSYAKKYSAPITPCAVVSYSGPPNISSQRFARCDVSVEGQKMSTILSWLSGQEITSNNIASKRSVLYKYSPQKYVNSSAVPTLIVHGAKDDTVSVNDVYDFVAVLKKNDVTYKFVELPDSGHALESDQYILKQSDSIFVDFANMYIK